MTLELKAMIRKIETFRTSLPDKLRIMQRFYDAVFSAGMRAGEIARWIPAEEKLPPKNTKVLVWFRENTTTGPIYIPRFGEISCGHWRPEGGNGNFDDRVTHWQPLPAAPEEKK